MESFGTHRWSSPMELARDPGLPVDTKLSLLIDWAWTEYLIDQATNEGMPENGRPSRLDEVDLALLALEETTAARTSDEALPLRLSRAGSSRSNPQSWSGRRRHRVRTAKAGHGTLRRGRGDVFHD